MNNQTEFYTKTMANVYARQGYFEKASEIYRYLLKHNPESREVNYLLFEVEKKLDEKKKNAGEILKKLFRKWIYLQLSYNRLQKLKKIKQYCKYSTNPFTD
ncbi:MAG: hypothetical protein K8R07_00110 [Desulfobacterales bacterium]|nr:hypothetical protein [Desulfobacterales bacterium]